MERDSNDVAPIGEDNCSQIEKAFKRMKVGTSRCDKKSHLHHLYQQPLQLQPIQQLQHQHQLSSNLTSTCKATSIHHQQQPLTPALPQQQPQPSQESTSSSSPLSTLSSLSLDLSSLSPLSTSSSPSASCLSSSSSRASSSSSSNYMGPYRDVTLSQIQRENLYPSHIHHQHQGLNENSSQYHPSNQSSENDNNNNHNNDNHVTKYDENTLPADPDVSVEELAAYLDVQLYIPRKMSYMAELMYT